MNIIFCFRYEGSTFGKPSTNNGCESYNAVIKQKYTLRNRLPLSAFLPKVEQMLKDWSEASIAQPFAVSTNICPESEVKAYQWTLNISRNDITHWFNQYYVVPSSEPTMTTATWLMLYRSSQWTSFDHFTLWQKSCWLVSPLVSCTCPIGLKQYTCKHSVGMPIILGNYQVSDRTRCEPLGKRRPKGRPKKVRTALFY